MPKTFEKHSIDQIELIANALMRAAGNFSGVLRELQAEGMGEVWIEWSRKHFDSLQLIAESARAASSMVEPQVIAKRAGVPSFYDKQGEKVERAAKLRKQRQASAGREPKAAPVSSPPKKRGRPKKNT